WPAPAAVWRDSYCGCMTGSDLAMQPLGGDEGVMALPPSEEVPAPSELNQGPGEPQPQSLPEGGPGSSPTTQTTTPNAGIQVQPVQVSSSFSQLLREKSRTASSTSASAPTAEAAKQAVYETNEADGRQAP